MSPQLYFLSGFTFVSQIELYPILEFVYSSLNTFFDLMIASTISKAKQEKERVRLEAVKRQKLEEAQQKQAQAQYNAQMNKYNKRHNENNKLRQRKQEEETERQKEADRSKQHVVDKYNTQLINSVANIASKKATTNPLNFPLRLMLNYKIQRIKDKQENSSCDISKQIYIAHKDICKHKGSSRALLQDPLIQDIIKQDKSARPSQYDRTYKKYLRQGLIRPFLCVPLYNCCYKDRCYKDCCCKDCRYKDHPIPSNQLLLLQQPQLPTSIYSQSQNDFVVLQNKQKEKERRIAALQIHLRDLDSLAVFLIIKGKTKIQQTLDLKELLQHSKNYKASDLQDKVYAFLGLAHKGYRIEPNYTIQNTII